jgi:hypothetical protein
VLVRGQAFSLNRDEVLDLPTTPAGTVTGCDVAGVVDFDEIAAHASGAGDLARLCALVADGRLEVEFEQRSWHDTGGAIQARALR